MPKPSAEYMIVMDPKESGRLHQWGLSVWEHDDDACKAAGRTFMKEVAWATGKGDQFVQREVLLKVAERWQGSGTPRIVIESNKTGTLTLMRDWFREHPDSPWKLYAEFGKNGLGWWSSAQSKARAIGSYIGGVKSGGILVSSRESVKQALSYDSQEGWKVGRDASGQTHHFDLLHTHFIAADVGKTLGWVLHRPGKIVVQEEVREDEVIAISEAGTQPAEYSVSEAYLEKMLGHKLRW